MALLGVLAAVPSRAGARRPPPHPPPALGAHMRRALVVVTVLMAAALAQTGTSTATKLPHLKSPGVVTARVAPGHPTKTAGEYRVEWVDDLRFANAPDQGALCIVHVGKPVRRSGLHLTVEAAHELAVELRAASEGLASVEVYNRRDRGPSFWQRFSAADARVLADEINAAVP